MMEKDELTLKQVCMLDDELYCDAIPPYYIKVLIILNWFLPQLFPDFVSSAVECWEDKLSFEI